MTHSVTVASWNIRDQLCTSSIRQKVLALDADIIVLPEAYPEAMRHSVELKAAFDEIVTSYDIHDVLYGDNDGRSDRHGLIMLTRKSLDATVEVLNIGRSALVAYVDGLRVVGVHFDDRKEATRIMQLLRGLRAVGLQPGIVIAGDFNATHPGTFLGRVLGMFSWLIARLPEGEPGQPNSALARVGSLAARLLSMTHSRVMVVLRRHGFHDADRRRQKTKLTELTLGLNVPLAQLDHIVVRGVEATRFERLTTRGSDHLPIRATIKW